MGPPSSRSDCTPSAASASSSSGSGPERSSSSEPSGSGPRPKASRRGWPRGVGTSRASSLGLSQRTVPMPTATASDAARIRCTSLREASPVTQRSPGTVTRPSSVIATLKVTNGRPLVDPRAPLLELLARAERELAVRERDLDAGRAQLLEPAALDARVRVLLPRDDPRYSRLERRVHARRSRARVRARLHRHVERGSTRPLAGRFQARRARRDGPCARTRSRPPRRPRRRRPRQRRRSASGTPRASASAATSSARSRKLASASESMVVVSPLAEYDQRVTGFT